MSRAIRILIGVAAVLYIGALVAVVYTLAGQQNADTRLTQQEKFDPCVSLSEAVANKAVDRIPPLTRDCKGFLNGIGPLVTIKLSCAIIEKARYVCPAPGVGPRRKLQANSKEVQNLELTRRDDAPQPAGQPPAGSHTKSGGHSAPHKPHGHKQPPKSPGSIAAPPPPPPAEAQPSAPAPPPEPGHSGNGASAEHGLDTCVELVVSACVKADVP